MVESSTVALRLLELIALLFPVVALLLQLQHRAVDSSDRVEFGGMVGIGLTILLSLSFFFVALFLVGTYTLSTLLVVSVAILAISGLLVPILVVLSLGQSVTVELEFASNARTVIRTTVSQMRQFYREFYRRWK